MRDKIILVFYIGCHEILRENVIDYVNEIAHRFEFYRDNTTEIIFIPCFEETDSRIECINPKLVNQKTYDEAMKVVETFKSKADEILKNLKNKINE